MPAQLATINVGLPAGLTALSAKWSDIRLVGKFAILFAVAGLLVASASFFALQRILEPTFTEIEQQVSTAQQARVRHALDAFNQDLNQVGEDYSNWDDL